MDSIADAASGLRAFARLVAREPGPGSGDRSDVDAVVRVARCFAQPVRNQGRTAAEIATTLEKLGTTLRTLLDEDESVRRDHPERAIDQMLAAVAGVIVEEEMRRGRELSGTIDVFTRTLSHELKNPIGAAEGGAQMMLDDAIAADPAQRRRFAEMIVRNLKRATALVSDLRLIITAQGGDDVRGTPRALRDVIGDAFHEVRGASIDRGIHLAAMEPFPELTVDGARVSLVLMNLVWNAVKYSDPSKPERWVRVGARRSDSDGWHCFVADNGLGIPEVEQGRVFDRFHRAHVGVAPGTGLGLSITREAIEQLGGRIWLESTVGVGSTFYFSLPDSPGTPGAAYEPAP